MFRFLIAFALFCPLVSRAQDPHHLPVSRITGLPSDAVYNLFQDSQGFIWIASNDGLTRYDGFEFKTYRSDIQTSQAGTHIKEDVLGRIWYQNFDGYVYYVAQDTLKGIAQNQPLGFIPFGLTPKHLFVLQVAGVDVFDLQTLTFLKTIPIGSQLASHSVSAGNDFFVCVDNDLMRITPDLNVFHIDCTLDAPLIEKHLYYLNEKVHVLFKNNLNRPIYQLRNNQLVSDWSVPHLPLIQGMAFLDSTYWILTPVGAIRVSSDGQPAGEVIFRDHSISSVIKDRQHNYWVSTTNNGILFVPDLSHRIISLPDIKPNRITEISGGWIIGGKKGELLRLDKDFKWTVLKNENSDNTSIQYLRYDSLANHIYYISNTLFRYNPVTGENIAFQNLAIKDLIPLSNGFFAYAASGNSGFLRTHSGLSSPWDTLTFQNTGVGDFSYILENSRGKSVAYLPDLHRVYFATNIGLMCLSPDSLFEIRDTGKSLYLSKLFVYRNQLFAVSTKNDLLEIGPENITYMNAALQIPREEVVMVRQGADELMVLHRQGIEIIHLDQQPPKAEKLDVSINAHEINDLHLKNGQVILLTDNGIIAASARSGSFRDAEARLVINQVSINGQPVLFNQPIQLSHTQNHLEINYSLLSFGAAHDIPAWYRINAQAWQPLSPKTRTLKFPALAPGAYTIELKAGTSAEVAVSLKITPPFWKQWWFASGIIVLFLGLLWRYYSWQTGILRQQNQLLQEKITLEQNLSRSILTSIKSQMNPHFFYNALNTIQSYIFANDKRNASQYLSRFSKLTRMILEMSERETISLQEEMEALNLYLDLEKTRFSEDFHFEILADENVDAEMIKIPPMIIQPYVENAVKHGLLHKKGNRALSIRFTRTPDLLVVSVDDNGVGRKRAAELSHIKNAHHRSFSSGANQKRLEILNQGKSPTMGIRIIDKLTDKGAPLGTRVEISIPIV